MKKKLIIFGAGEIAQLAKYYFTTDSDYEVAAFTVDAAFQSSSSFCDLPVIPFESLTRSHPPEFYEIFIAISYSKLNQIRKEKFLAAKELGYYLPSYISSKATVLNNMHIGENCFILEDNTIQPFVSIEDNVTLWSGNHIGHHSVIRSHSFFASHIVISGGVEVGEQCFIGVNATIRDHVQIGPKCVIGAGALILASTDAEGVYLGTPSERSRVPSSRLRKI
ncbi:acetyltransferase [Pollutimonas sp. H1-120]|uniref:acetyltransferase n=1 Tax=Pollutimonas sp. H1-120 TaxID=3148824 RepID=UPI003B52EB4A